MRRIIAHGRSVLRQGSHAVACAAAAAAAQLRSADIAFFHDFAPPPSGGGHQFLRALWRELAGRGWRIENNRISRTTRLCLFNSYNFDFRALRAMLRRGCRMLHRVDGPLCVYRGSDDGTDRRIWELNQSLADATVFQSQFSLESHAGLGFAYRKPILIRNAADPALFHPRGRPPAAAGPKVRLISTSWSDNPNKGAAIYDWLDAHLDWNRFDYVFVGRLPLTMRHIRVEPPATSERVAALLRESDVYITASRHDPCSNSLVEALSCGLPVLYLRSGGHAELAGGAGLGFDEPDQVPALLDRLLAGYREYCGRIQVPSIQAVADAYLAAGGLPPMPEARA